MERISLRQKYAPYFNQLAQLSVAAGKIDDTNVYQPGNPLADAKGYVRMPNVDVVGEMVNTMSASRSYQANVEVLNTVKQMMMKTLTMGQ